MSNLNDNNLSEKINRLTLQNENLKAEVKILTSIFNTTPLSITVFDKDKTTVMGNNETLRFFDAKSSQEYIDGFFSFSPEYQPDGRKSVDAANEFLNEGFKKGFVKFNWLHCTGSGKDLPCEVVLIKLDAKDKNGSELLAGFARNITENLSDDDSGDWSDYYFRDKIPENILFRTVAELSEELFFAVDLRTSLVQFFGKGREIFKLKEEKVPFPSHLIKNKIVHKEDCEQLEQLAAKMMMGERMPLDLRLMPKGGEPVYYRMIYQTLFDKNNKPAFAIGKAYDINEQKTLEIMSKTDLLTNCYNKITTETLIADAILENSDTSHAMFIVDIDNFKAINDNLGHHFGDLVLSEIASNLRTYFRNADIIGRIGGDEFIVFLKNVNDNKIIEGKANKISKAFQNTYSGENKSYKISGSIGIALYPIHGTSYEALYKSADKALYQSKLKGKDCYTFYSEKFMDGTMKNITTLENASRIANSYFDAELVSTVFNLMYETQEINSSLNAVLQFIGKRSGADRCYIFETFDNGKTYSNTYEWCEKDVVPEIDNLQGLTAEILYDFFASADEKGIFYSNDLRLLKAEGAFDLMNDQGIKSFLHAQTKEKGIVKLFLGLDDCKRTRVWSEKEINSILYAAKMISIFLLSGKRIGYSTNITHYEL